MGVGGFKPSGAWFASKFGALRPRLLGFRLLMALASGLQGEIYGFQVGSGRQRLKTSSCECPLWSLMIRASFHRPMSSSVHSRIPANLIAEAPNFKPIRGQKAHGFSGDRHLSTISAPQL